jgi:hypothetical protein
MSIPRSGDIADVQPQQRIAFDTVSGGRFRRLLRVLHLKHKLQMNSAFRQKISCGVFTFLGYTPLSPQ